MTAKVRRKNEIANRSTIRAEASLLSFKAKMEEAARSKNSRIILALDFPFEVPENRFEVLAKAQKILKAVHPYICAVKINHHLILPLGAFDGMQQLVKQIQSHGLPLIMDAKVNDVGATNQVIAQYYFAAGFDALIANPFIGWEEGIKPLFEASQPLKKGIIILGYMSHKGASEGYGQTIIDQESGQKVSQYVSFAKKALKWGADGIVVGATVPQKITEIKTIVGDYVPIYSPGVGAQGGIAAAAVKAGAKYLIVGREITMTAKPAQAAQKVRDSIVGI
jgi:orotidine-5'-phosphate decarboxylase